MLAPCSRRSQAALTALAEGTRHPGSGSDPNLLKICAEKKIALKEQCQRQDSARFGEIAIWFLAGA